MRCVAGVAYTCALLSAGAQALELVQRENPAVLSMRTERAQILDPVTHDRERMVKRDAVLVDVDQSQQALYYANVTIGTPPQSIRLHLDTGSSDLWTNTPSSRICSDRRGYCRSSGTYDPTKSTTYKQINSAFQISYVDGSGASGDYVSDTITIGGTTVDGLEFGVGYQSSNVDGILGIGYAANEAIVGVGAGSTYKNLPQLMVANGIIQSNAYSLWLNDLSSSTGEILFGGVNTEKYHGALSTLPIQTRRGQSPSEFLLALTGVGFDVDDANSSIISSSLPAAALLDSGSSLTYLPNDVVDVIYTTVNAQYSQYDGVALCDCSLAQNNSFLTFNFSGPIIAVPFNELVLSASAGGGSTQGTGSQCIFGVAPAGNNPNILGDTFLRSAYVVYDLDNNQISLAQTNFNSSQDHVVQIGTGSNAVPDATGVASPVTVQATATGGGRVGFGANPQSTITVTPTGSSASKGGAIQTQVPLGMLAAVGAGALWVL